MHRRGRIFRIFVSSTFSDLKEERNALQKRVFPKLRELCMQHGCRFQAIDLRWGVREEASLDQQTMKICFEEIKRCQEITPRPNFIVLLGDRYGWCPLPYEIPANEFEEILTHVMSQKDTELLTKWYWRDDNAVPPVYDLQPREREYTERTIWEPVERGLHSILLETVRNMDLSEENQSKYWASATEQEIRRGALNPKMVDAHEHVFCFFRTIKDMLQDQNAKEYIDLDEDGNLDHKAQSRLADLKERLEKRLPNNTFRYEAKWTKNGVTTDYINQLLEDILRNLTQVIEREIAGLEEIDPLDEEIDAHVAFGKERIRAFTGREDIITAITDYIKGPSIYPYVIHGESGSGKTAVMTKMVERAKEECPEARVFFRFIGATPESSDGRSLLESLCRQIYRDFEFEKWKQRELAEIKKDDEGAQQRRQEIDQEYEIPTDFQKLSSTFSRFLSEIPSRERLILFIDALDQLSPSDHARNLTWLPSRLPENVKMVVSVLPGDCLSVIERKLPEKSLQELKPMPLSEGTDLLNSWLDTAGRTLQQDQRKEVLDKFKENGLPLYLKLLFEEARRWKSYTTLVNLSTDIPGIIHDFFNRLSSPANHGPIMVSHSMGYLATAKNGLTEDEMIDVLSLDRTVFEDFMSRTHHKPTEPKLPVVIWLRLYHDLEPYLTERMADETSVLSFYHRQLLEVVDDIFFKNDAKQKCHRALAGYFDRQPLWIEGQGKRTPNIRKVSELPYQQMHGEMWDDLEQTLCDLYFIESKCAAGMTYDLIADYNAAINALPEARFERDEEEEQDKKINKYNEDLVKYAKGESKEIRIPASVKPWSNERIKTEIEKVIYNPTRLNRIKAFSQFVNSESHGLVNFGLLPSFCLQQAFNYTCSGPVHNVVEKVMRDSRLANILLLKAETHRLQFNPYPEQIRMFIGHRSWVRDVKISLDGEKALSGSSDGTMRVWDLKSGECLRVEAEQGLGNGIDSVSYTPDFNLAIAGGWDSIIYVWNLESGECLVKLKGHTDWITCLSITPDGKKAVSGSRDRTLRLWDIMERKCIARLEGHTAPIYGVGITPDGKIVVSASTDKTLRLWDLEKKVCIGKLEGHEKSVYSVSITPDGKIGVSGSSDKTVRVWNLENKKCITTLEGHQGWVRSTCVTPDGKLALSGSWDGSVRLWDLENSKCLREFKGHTDLVETVSISADGRTAISGGADNTMRVWNPENGTSYGKIDGHTASIEGLAISPDGSKIVSASRDWTLRVWDMKDGHPSRILGKHKNIVKSVGISSDGKIAVSTSWDRSIKVWDLKSETLLRSLDGEPDRYGSLHISLDGRQVWDRTLRKWDLETGECLREQKELFIDTEILCGTPDGRLIVFGGLDKTIKVFNVEKRECVRTFERQSEDITCIKVTPDGTRVVTGSKDGKLCVWDPRSGHCIHVLSSHTEGISSVSISQDCGIVVSGSWDKSLRVWDLQTGKNIAVCSTNSDITAISDIGAFGRFACGTHSGEVILFNVYNPFNPIPVITPIRLWIHGIAGSTGIWEKKISATCFWCGKRFVVPDEILKNISTMTNKAAKQMKHYSCFDLPSEFLNDPLLESHCRNCEKPVKYNPYIIDNRGAY